MKSYLTGNRAYALLKVCYHQSRHSCPLTDCSKGIGNLLYFITHLQYVTFLVGEAQQASILSSPYKLTLALFSIVSDSRGDRNIYSRSIKMQISHRKQHKDSRFSIKPAPVLLWIILRQRILCHRLASAYMIESRILDVTRL